MAHSPLNLHNSKNSTLNNNSKRNEFHKFCAVSVSNNHSFLLFQIKQAFVSVSLSSTRENERLLFIRPKLMS